jgi:hypothetical protein
MTARAGVMSAALLLLGYGGGGAMAQTAPFPDPAPTEAHRPPEERATPPEVIAYVRQSHELQARLGRLAAEAGADEEVRRFGRLVALDQRRAVRMVNRFMRPAALPVDPAPLPALADRRARVEALERARAGADGAGRAFQTRLLTAIEEGARADLEKGREALRAVLAPDLRTPLAESMSLWEQHAEIARTLRERLAPVGREGT